MTGWHGAWFVRYRDRVRQKDGSIKLRRKANRLARVEECPTKTDIEPLRTSFMQKINARQFDPDSSMTLSDFVEKSYLPWVETELRASTHKGYREIWENHIRQRVGNIRLREFRTVHASKMLRAIADESDLTKTTLQHIKSVLSAIFTYAKNEDAFDGANPVQGAMIPGKARDPGDTFAYNLVQILRILQILPLLPKAVWPPHRLPDSARANYGDWNGRITRGKL